MKTCTMKTSAMLILMIVVVLAMLLVSCAAPTPAPPPLTCAVIPGELSTCSQAQTARPQLLLRRWRLTRT